MEALAHQVQTQDKPNPGTAYLAGLLANFGTLVLGHVFPPQYETICRIQESNPQVHHTYVDQHVLTLNREVIAASLLELWELPDEVTTALRYQFVENYNGEHKTFVNLLTTSHKMLDYVETDSSSDLTKLCEELEMDWDGVESVIETLRSSRDELGEIARSF